MAHTRIMVITTRDHLWVRRAASIHFPIAFFPTLATLTYTLSPRLPLTIAAYGTIAYCVSITVYLALLIVAVARGHTGKPLARSVWWVVAAQIAFLAQWQVISGLIQHL